jgi:hypothetical protein
VRSRKVGDELIVEKVVCVCDTLGGLRGFSYGNRAAAVDSDILPRGTL